MEVYGRGAIVDMANARARSLNIDGLDALDIRTLKHDGTAWDFDTPKCQEKALRLIAEDDPGLRMACPECSPFCSLQGWNYQ